MKKIFAILIVFSLISLNFTSCESTDITSEPIIKTEKLFFPKVDIIKIGESFEKEFSVI
jgi:hypothetical protein